MKRLAGAILGILCWVNLGGTATYYVANTGSSSLANSSAPVIPNPRITSVTINPTSPDIQPGAALYFNAVVKGTGDYDRALTWSVQPANAGLLTATGLFIASSAFSGSAQVTATSVGNTQRQATATVMVSAGDGVRHVDSRNAGTEDGTPRYPFRKIQSAVNVAASGDTIKTAQGTYNENILLPNRGMILLGGFAGGSAIDYQSKPGDFDTRAPDLYVTTISSPDRSVDSISMADWYESTETYAIDGFAITQGRHGILLEGQNLTFFISHNSITDNGVLQDSYFAGGGISTGGINVKILNNTISNNQGGRGGGLAVGQSPEPFFIERNILEKNSGGADHAGGVYLTGLRGIFTKNLVRNNKANQLTGYGWGGGLLVVGDGFSPTPDPNKNVELSYNIYTGNEAKTAGGGVFIDDGCKVIMKHELIYKNKTTTDNRGAAGLYVDGPLTVLTLTHCTLADNQGVPGTTGNGIYAESSSTVAMDNSILWGNTEKDIYGAPTLTVSYCDSQPLYPGAGNISQDPLFADASQDDYHLKSRRGRWSPAINTWVADLMHSPGIDAANPAVEFVNEPLPNGAQANLGAYGNTYEAGKSLRADSSYLSELLLD